METQGLLPLTAATRLRLGWWAFRVATFGVVCSALLLRNDVPLGHVARDLARSMGAVPPPSAVPPLPPVYEPDFLERVA